MALLKTVASKVFVPTKSLLPILSEAVRPASTDSTNLKDVLGTIIPKERKRVAAFRKEYGRHKIGEVTVEQVYGGMRGIKGLVCETSVLDPDLGIEFRNHTIEECQEKLTKAPGDGEEPLPEALFWLLVTNQFPTEAQTRAVSKELTNRADVPSHVVQLLNNFPATLHPMAQFNAAITACNSESVFAKAYADHVPKATFWEYVYEDALNIIAKLPTIAAIIYRNLYRDGTNVGAINQDLDWSANFTSMLGYEDPMFTELMRLYLTLHGDHEGGNVSAHACHLVGSALADPYLSVAAGMHGLAGPLHGLANQEVLTWTKRCMDALGGEWTKDSLKDFIKKVLETGNVIPGFGHAVLRKTDPRYLCQRQFAQKHLPNDPLFHLVSDLFDVVPDILIEHGKATNPWPNVDAHSGVLLQHYGMTETNFYTVLVGISRALGCLSQLIWDRALGLPIERPKSINTDGLMELVGANG